MISDKEKMIIEGKIPFNPNNQKIESGMIVDKTEEEILNESTDFQYVLNYKLAKLKKNFSDLDNEDFTFNGKTYQGDLLSQNNILTEVVAIKIYNLTEIKFTLKDNTRPTISESEFLSMAESLRLNRKTLRDNYNTKRQSIYLIETEYYSKTDNEEKITILNILKNYNTNLGV